LAFVGLIVANEAHSTEMKKVCHDVKGKQICKDIKVHKKLSGDDQVPTKNTKK